MPLSGASGSACRTATSTRDSTPRERRRTATRCGRSGISAAGSSPCAYPSCSRRRWTRTNSSTTEAAAVHADTYRERPDDYGQKLRAIIEAGFHVPAPAYVRAQQIRTILIEAIRGLMRDVDVLATPSAPGPAPAGLGSTGSPVYNRPFSFLGFPSITVPCGFTKGGLPLGIQFGGRPFEEVTLLSLAAAYEGATQWGERIPPL